MGRHNREGEGADQYGFIYKITYQPDWLKRIRVSRRLPSGHRSTKTLFINPDPVPTEPGEKIRRVVWTRIRCPELGVSVAVAVDTETTGVDEVKVKWNSDPEAGPWAGWLVFTLTPF